MPTPPISADLVTKLKDATAWRFNSKFGPQFYPRFFCCTDPNTLGLADGKDPVAIIDLDPNPALTGETVNYTGTASYDPDGSITNYAWTFESHSPSSGTASNGTLNYGTAGTYTIKLIVTDGTGLKSTPAQTDLVVNDPTWQGYIATSDGVFYSDGTAPLSWEDKNSGLSGDDLEAYAVAIDPATQHLDEDKKAVWRATKGGIQVSNDGGNSWTEKNPGTVTNTWGDSPAPTPGSVTFEGLLFTGTRLWAYGNWTNAGGDERSRLFYTDDANDMIPSTSGSVTWSEVTS